MDVSVLEPIVRRPDTAGIFLDFDGTLSEIVPVPSDARPAEGAREVLTRLTERHRVVAIVSGRSAGQLIEWLGPDVEIWGVHGAERSHMGAAVVSPSVALYSDVMRRAHAAATEEMKAAGVAGAILEDKGTAITLHYRTAIDPDRAQVVLRGIAARLADRYGLGWAPGRASFELRPPAAPSKAGVVLERARAENLEAAMFVGDDVVDLPAFDALDELSREGVAVVRVAVASAEGPRELLQRADLVVDGVTSAMALLRALAEGDTSHLNQAD